MENQTQRDKPGILLVNLGTPDAPSSAAVKRYLKQFLMDKRVVDLTRFIWCPLLHWIIVPFRSPRVAKLYQSVWMEQGSPLRVYSQRQRDALAKRTNLPVALGMSYGQPALSQALDSLLQQGVNRLVVLPLYPQFSSTTVCSVWDGLHRYFRHRRTLPSITFIRDYATHPAYINALKASVERAFLQQGRPELLLLSFHGIPKRYAREGDDYPLRCNETTCLLRSALGLSEQQLIMTYQSRFGREPWLTPYTDETIKRLPSEGIKHILVMSPGFAADCLETLEELQVQNREFFLDAGGEKFGYIPALNDDELHISMLYELTHRGMP